jgi:hypothetical protein
MGQIADTPPRQRRRRKIWKVYPGPGDVDGEIGKHHTLVYVQLSGGGGLYECAAAPCCPARRTFRGLWVLPRPPEAHAQFIVHVQRISFR